MANTSYVYLKMSGDVNVQTISFVVLGVSIFALLSSASK